jgi:hypothetical protein
MSVKKSKIDTIPFHHIRRDAYHPLMARISYGKQSLEVSPFLRKDLFFMRCRLKLPILFFAAALCGVIDPKGLFTLALKLQRRRMAADEDRRGIATLRLSVKPKGQFRLDTLLSRPFLGLFPLQT